MARAAMWMVASLLCLTSLVAHVCCKNVVGIIGENFTFPLQIDQKIVEAVWRKSEDKVAEWEWQNKPMYFGPLRSRGVLMENGSLTIVNLQKDDAGPYELLYRVSGRDHYLKFELAVLDSLPEPKISCNTSNGELVLNCTADFQGSLNYSLKLSNDPQTHWKQELFISLEKVDSTTNATCIIKFLQTERSSEISLLPCLPEEKGESSYKRSRGALIAVFILAIMVVILVVYLRKKGRRTAQNNHPENSSELQQFFPGSSQQQPNSEEAAFLNAAHCENEEPEADRALNEDDSALKDKQIVKNGVNQEETLKRNSSLLANHAEDHGINEGEVTQDAEGGDGEHVNNSSSCSKEDLKA